MLIGIIREQLKNTLYMGALLKKYSSSLALGKYHLFNSFLAMSLEDVNTQKNAAKYFHLQHPYPERAKAAAFLNKIGYYQNRNKNTSGEYEAFYVANNGDKVREVKLFSFKTKRLLSICTDREKMLKQLNEYNLLSDAYKMPAVKKSEKYENALEVDMVDRMPSPDDGLALSAIAASTMANNPEPAKLLYKSAKDLIAFSYDDKKMCSMLSDLIDYLDDELLKCTLPLCLQHGDLSKDNLIYGESKGITGYWWIDWEHIEERVFFYDYFFYILNSAIYGDLEAFSCYMDGKNDEVLKAYFAHLGLNFVPSKRWGYFIIYAICFLKERVCDLGNVSTLERYCEFINKHRPERANNGGSL